ncbi:MAG: hypothetical protein C0419_06045, partial [Microbacterium sp.]|nr:hypothetical protein [Microbacterium sp.]
MKTRIIAIASILGGAAVLTTGGVLIANSLGASPTSEPAFTAVELADIQIIQQASSTYDVSFAVPDELASESSTIAVELTKLDEYSDDAIELDATIDSGRVLVDGLELDAGDHFLWVEVGGEPVSTPITIPDMTPHVWLDGGTPTLEFGQEGRSSWSSYVDPEGKNVFRSASAAFDDSAQPIAENLPITETSFRDNAFTSDEPYYFLVFTGKDGNATFVSSSLFTTATQGDVAVDFVTEGGEPFVVITGSVYASSDATDRRLELRVGNFDSADPTSTFMVENSVSDDATTAFRFVVPAQQLEPGTNNLALFVHEDGSMLEWSIRAPSVDMSRTLQVGQTVFGVTNADALQLTRADLAYQSLRLSIRESNGEALLSVTGTFTPAFSDAGTTLIIKDSEGESYTVTDRNASGSGFSFSFALERLGKAGIWYDIDFVNPESEAVSPIMTRAVSDMRQWLELDGRTYALADFQGTTKVFFERFPFENASVEFRTISGVPTLVAQGSLVDVRTSDAFMRIRTGDTIAGDVRNISTRPGEFLFRFPLANLGQPGVWYDVVFGDRSTQSLRDFTTSAVSDMSATLVAGQRTYGYREWNGQLKVAYERSVGSIDLTSGEFVEVGGVATLRLTGTMTGLAQDDAFLRVRTAGESFDFANVAPTAGDVQFDVTLSNLTNANTWYDLVVGNVPENSLTDVLPSIVNMAQTLTSDNRTYDFREFNNQLKVNFSPAAAGSVSIASAQIVDVAGVPTLRVEGSVTGLSQSDVFLRVRTGAQTVDAANTAASAGNALFVVDLSTLSEANTWYDLVVGVTSTG